MDPTREPMAISFGADPVQAPYRVTVPERIRVAVDALPVEGIAQDRLDAILAGERRPTSLDLALIAEATGVTTMWLLHGRRCSRPVSAT